MKLFNFMARFFLAIAGTLFGPESHSINRNGFYFSGSTIKAIAGENLYSGAMVSLIDNPKRKKYQFWKPKKVAIGTFTERKPCTQKVLIDLNTMKIIKVIK